MDYPEEDTNQVYDLRAGYVPHWARPGVPPEHTLRFRTMILAEYWERDFWREYERVMVVALAAGRRQHVAEYIATEAAIAVAGYLPESQAEKHRLRTRPRTLPVAEKANRATVVVVLEKSAGPGRPRKHPFNTIEPGQSFLIEPGPDQPKLSTIRVACSRVGADMGAKFRCHRHENGTIEVWRKS